MKKSRIGPHQPTHFKHFLTGSHFTNVTDHKHFLALRKLKLENDLTGRRARWLIELDTFDFSIIHKDGKKHSKADALSRIPKVNAIDIKSDTTTPTSPLLREESPPEKHNIYQTIKSLSPLVEP